MLSSETLKLRPTIYSAPEMRNDYRASNDETYRERFEQLGARHALLGAASQMIRHAVITPKHQRRDESEQLLGLDVERPGFIRARVEGKETVHDEISFAEDLRVHPLAELAKLL
jgi:hypothetical protein